MQEVLLKVSQLVTLLEEKIAATEVLNGQLSTKKVALEDNERKQAAAANQLAARERVLGNIESAVAEKAEAKEFSKKASAKNVLNNKKEAELKEMSKKLIEESVEIESMRSVFKKKNANMDAMKIQLETEKKLMKEKLLDELKGRL